jgi:hypothetical protein
MVEGQIVFCEQIHLECRPDWLGYVRLLGRPRDSAIASEVATSAPRHPFVRQPLLRQLKVAIEILGNRALELTKQIGVAQRHEWLRNLE